eukprot:scaffold8760_cov116-Isochrysis_galbana.AAC.2
MSGAMADRTNMSVQTSAAQPESSGGSEPAVRSPTAAGVDEESRVRAQKRKYCVADATSRFEQHKAVCATACESGELLGSLLARFPRQLVRPAAAGLVHTTARTSSPAS